VQKYITPTVQSRTGCTLIANKCYEEGPPRQIQTALNKAVKHSTEYEEQLVAQAESAAGKGQRPDLTPAQRKVCSKTLRPGHQELGSRMDTALLDQFYQLRMCPGGAATVHSKHKQIAGTPK
jgi:hypothetical protein